MDFEKLTSKSKEVIEDVINLAVREKHQYISPLHLLKVLLDEQLIADLILKSGGSLGSVRIGQNIQSRGSIGSKPDVAGIYSGHDGSRKACGKIRGQFRNRRADLSGSGHDGWYAGL